MKKADLIRAQAAHLAKAVPDFAKHYSGRTPLEYMEEYSYLEEIYLNLCAEFGVVPQDDLFEE